MRFYLYFIFIFFLQDVWAQKYTVRGNVTDAETGEKLIGANVYDAKNMQGMASNNYGFYSITLSGGNVLFTCSFIGYQTFRKEFLLTCDTVFNIEMQPSIELGEVQIIDKKIEEVVINSQMSKIDISVQKIKMLPSLFGETDVLKTIQLMPGVQSGNEGTSGMYVRGGGPDQNLILLDGVPVYNSDHLFGFFSVFNADAIQNVKLIKGGFPARYGGRLSSVLDIYMKEGNNKKFKSEGSIGIIASKITLEGPLFKGKTTYIISARRSYIDLLAQPFYMSTDLENGKINAGYYFYDINSKINYTLSPNHKIYLSIYQGKDRAYTRYKESFTRDDIDHNIRSEASLGWGNITTALRWNYIVSNKLFCNTTFTYSRYHFSVGEEYKDNQKIKNKENLDVRSFKYSSGINDAALRADFDYAPGPKHNIKFGSSAIYHTFIPGINIFRYTDFQDQSDRDTSFGNNDIYAWEFASYVEDDIRIGSRISVNTGLHYSGFRVDSVYYQSLQPRISVSFMLNEKWAVKGAFSRMSQYIHLLSNATIGLPTDLWLPSTADVRPQQSYQYNIGTVYVFKSGWETSLEGFYKTMEHCIEYLEGASFFSIQDDWQKKITFGKGWSYGTELLFQKTSGKTTGWIGYTLSWSFRRFDQLNQGKTYSYKYDRRHDISFTLSHKFSERFDIGVTWVFGTGNAVTLATEKYMTTPYSEDGKIFYFDEIEYYSERNNYRMPSYHRLDIGVNFYKQKKWWYRTWSFGLYNVYNRYNPFYLRFGYDETGQAVLKQISLFPVIPFVRYSFKF